MSNPIGDQFIEALHTLEEEGDLVPILGLFDENSTIWNLQMSHPHRGCGEVEKFWDGYRKSFADIHSEFTHREESDHCIVLEWVSRGTRPTGESIEYSGVTILEHDGSRVGAFRSYYDTHAVSQKAA